MATGADSRLLDLLAGAVLVAHWSDNGPSRLRPSDVAASVRVVFFFVQGICILAMAASIGDSAVR
jgi:hypothetical protein